MDKPVRLAADRLLPPYTYVPGRTPHPVSDPRGHSYGAQVETPPALDPQRPETSPTFLYAVDLFNHGFPWEAHEHWEALWLACGRKGRVADLLKGLIKLAAACVKAREGNAEGRRRHARRAKELFEQTHEALGAATASWCGLRLDELCELASGMVDAGDDERQPVLPLDRRVIDVVRDASQR